MDHPTAADLAAMPLFATMPEDARAELARRFEVEEFAAGRSVFREGQAGYVFYVVAEGRVSVSHDGETVSELGPGDYFGEIAILGDGRRTATVTALEPLVAWALFGTAFRVLQTERPEVAAMLTAAMNERLDRA